MNKNPRYDYFLNETVFNGGALKNITDEHIIECSMDNALKRGHFIPYLQPKINCRTLETVGAEALVRWNDPCMGIIMPGQFLPYFENSGFITRLDLHMFEQSCMILKRWIDSPAAPVPISCNFSYNDIRGDTIDRIIDIACRHNIPPHLLEIEITEVNAIKNPDACAAHGRRIREYGIKLCVDDFGAGYSPISLLQKMPIDTLKFDGGFIAKGYEQKFFKDMLKGFIKVLKKYSVRIICEGIETEEQRDFVSGLGCDIIQGFLYSKPLPVREFEDKYLKNK